VNLVWAGFNIITGQMTRMSKKSRLEAVWIKVCSSSS